MKDDKDLSLVWRKRSKFEEKQQTSLPENHSPVTEIRAFARYA